METLISCKQIQETTAHSQNHGATILDLPTELVMHILSVDSILTSKDIFSASFLSRRFNAIAMPMFLASHGITDPERETSVYVTEWNPNHALKADEPDALSGLNGLTYISKVNHLKVFFQDPDSKSVRNTSQEAYHLPEAVKRVSKFVQRLNHIGTAEIYLMWDPYFIARARSMNHVPISEIKKWANSFGYLLNLLVLRGCTSLTIQYDPTIAPPFHFRSNHRIKRAWSFLSQNMHRRDGRSSVVPQLQWDFERPLHSEKGEDSPVEQVSSPILSSLGQGFNHITYLAIHSPTLLLPPFVNWTLSLLSSHPQLSSLSFAYITFSKDMWTTILPFVAEAVSHKLTELSFYKNCPELDVDNLLRFLCHLPKLRRLTLDRSFRSRVHDWKPYKSRAPFLSSPTTGIPSFLHLETLHAPVELVSLLLNCQPGLAKDGVSLLLPRLRNLAVYPSCRLIHPPSYIKSSLTVNALLRRMNSQPRAYPIVYSLDAQMEFTDFGPVSQYINTIITRQEFRRVVWETLSEADIDSLMKNNTVPVIAFIHITHLFLYRLDAPKSTCRKAPAALCVWINLLFPNLECLEFTCQMEANPRQQQGMDRRTIEWLTKALTDTCPQVHTLIIGKTEYRLRHS